MSMGPGGAVGGSPTGTGSPAQYTGAGTNNRMGNAMALVGAAVVGVML
jgi:hypothetical protein